VKSKTNLTLVVLCLSDSYDKLKGCFFVFLVLDGLLKGGGVGHR